MTGIKQLFQYQDRPVLNLFLVYMQDGLFYLFPELKSIPPAPGLFKKNWNTDAVAAFVQFGYVPTLHCIFIMHKLKPGHSFIA